MGKSVLTVFLLWVTWCSLCQTIDIGIYRSHDVTRIEFKKGEGTYSFTADTSDFGEILANEKIILVKSSSKVEVIRNGVSLGIFNKIYFSPRTTNSALSLTPTVPSVKARMHYGDFIVSSGSKGLTIVNRVSYFHYLGGVIQSEGGIGWPLEYYKAQAVISRTYAMKYVNRHSKDGFSLCDQVHCQAYFSRTTNPTIIQAVKETDGVYMIDSLGSMVQSYFHANCGGETSQADYIWNENIHYLQPIKDPFCTHTKQATWETRVPKKKWRDFLVNKYFYPIEDSIYAEHIYYFEQEDRKAFYLSPHLGIPLRDIRYEFKLKSTFFSCYPEGDDVVIKGRGFGHGVGLCQEGAMEMAKRGYGYRQILQFYFGGIQFVDREEKRHFKETNGDEFDF